MHVRTYGHHGYGSKLFDGEMSEMEVVHFLKHFMVGEWTQDNDYPLIGLFDGIILKPHIYSQYSKPYLSRNGWRTGKHTFKLIGRIINCRAATGSCTEVEFDNENDALKIWKMIFPNSEIKYNENYIFGKIINGKEAGFEINMNIYEMYKWDVNVVKNGPGYGRVYIGEAIA